MAKPLNPPPFRIPLNDEQLILMGKIAIVWGQVDEKFNWLLQWALKLDKGVYARLVQAMPAGAKAALIPLAIERSANPHNAALFALAKSQFDSVLPRRNAAMHGCWGEWIRKSDRNPSRVGIWNHQKPKERFFVDQLPNLYEDISSLLRTLTTISINSLQEPSSDQPSTQENCAIYFVKRPSELAGRESQIGDLVILTEV